MDITAALLTILIGLSNIIIVQVCCRQSGGAGAVFGGTSYGNPCVHEGHLITEKSWFGYIANITILSTGRLTFEFIYPAERCCQNVLFYTEDQISIISNRLSCWQKEYLLRPEEDQLLRLTPSFSWSGCHATRVNGVDTYVCKGGRSFTVGQELEEQAYERRRPVTWHVAVSNCAAPNGGLDLWFRLEVYGHVGECRPSNLGASPTTTTECPTPQALPALHVDHRPTLRSPVHVQAGGGGEGGGGGSVGGAPAPFKEEVPMPVAAQDPSSSPESKPEKPCIVEGMINTTHNWYGFIRNITFHAGGGFRYRFTFPFSMQVINVILYRDTDIVHLHWEQTCWQKEIIIHDRLVPEQIIDLSHRTPWSGCTTKTGAPRIDGNNLSCVGEKTFEHPERIHIGVSNCRAADGLRLQYRLEVFGFDNASEAEVCNSATSLARFLIFTSPCCTLRYGLAVFVIPAVLHSRTCCCYFSLLFFVIIIQFCCRSSVR